jgi:hypothetical protein
MLAGRVLAKNDARTTERIDHPHARFLRFYTMTCSSCVYHCGMPAGPLPRILGTTKLEDGDTIPCEHCGRPIRHLVYLSTGPTVGRQCALKALGYTRAKLDDAPYISPSLNRIGGFFGYVMQDGRIMRAERGYRTGGGYTEWKLTPAEIQPMARSGNFRHKRSRRSR